MQFTVEPPVKPIKANVYRSTAKPKPPLTAEEWTSMAKPKVLIVGAGLGGLMLGHLLHRAKIPFTIFERANEVKNLGSVMSLGSTVWTLFQQLDMLEEFKKIGKPTKGLEVFNDNRETHFSLGSGSRLKYCGAKEYLVSRPDLYDLFLRQVPKENILMGKKVLNFEQSDFGIMIQCDDNKIHHGDILVGADGAHSAVRQHLYKILKDRNLLPWSDEGDLPFNCVCLVGQTEVLDPKDFPYLELPHSKFNSVLGTKYGWVQATTIKNTICWAVIQTLNNETAKDSDAFRNAKWGPEATEAMCKEIRHFKIPGGKEDNLTMGDLIDRTPKDLISKIMLEEKLSPSGGAGALTAIHDAVALANWIATLRKPKLEDIEAIFAEYQAERLPIAWDAVWTTNFFKRITITAPKKHISLPPYVSMAA
ncbi:hypothetical protein CPB97_010205 [Podila verticillata]|nr:hypothetical protein CPB97_010205 [Podila verticillata]